jgi:hypothetical protein
MKLQPLPGKFAVCQLPQDAAVDTLPPLTFLAQTGSERSWVGPIDRIPQDALRIQRDFVGFRVAGSLDFSLVGILADIAQCLAARCISLFVISTYDTDYIWVPAERWPEAREALAEDGHTWSQPEDLK